HVSNLSISAGVLRTNRDAMSCKGMPIQIPRDAEYSDLIIECQGTKFKANRVVMASASSVIATVLKQNNLQVSVVLLDGDLLA
ncbi:hypothetical protein KEM55_008227, partial [Ascosphaera atra]